MRAVRWTLYGVFAVVLTGVMALLPIVFARRVDRFAFLGGRAPLQFGVLPHFETLTDTTPMSEFRLYSWQERFDVVLARAQRELGTENLKRYPGGNVSWMSAEGTSVWLSPSQGRTLAEASRSKPDPGWVTVLTDDDAPETWLSQLRVWFAPEW